MILIFLVCFMAIPASARAQVTGDTAAVLELVRLSGEAQLLTAAEWGQLPFQTVHADDPGGPNHAPIRGAYRGVPLRALLNLIEVPEGVAIRGAALRLYVVVEALDGYRVLFSLAELDPGLTDATVVVAATRDGVALEAHEGPLRIIAPGEKRPARWVRNVVRISVHHVP